MALNVSKRKRSVPEWMKSPPESSPQKGSGGKGNVSHIQRAQRPSYPPIPIRKTKQLPKLLDEWELETDSAGPSNNEPLHDDHDPVPSTSHDRSVVCDDLSLYKVTEKELDEFTMTVDDLTSVAKEVIKEERQKRTSQMLSRKPSKLGHRK